MSNIFTNSSNNMNNVTTSQRKKIFNIEPSQSITPNQLQIPTLTIKPTQNSLQIDQEISYIAPQESEQKQDDKSAIISQQEKSQLNSHQEKQSQLLKDVQLDNLENLVNLIKTTNNNSHSGIQGSKLMYSSIEPQYYQQIESDAERCRDLIKGQGRAIHTIIEKHSKLTGSQENILNELKKIEQELIKYEKCTSFQLFSKQVKYVFNQFESKQDQLRDIYNETFNFMQVISVAAYEKKQESFQQQEFVSEAEFTSLSMKLYSDIEFLAKEFEIALSEKRRLGNINQNHVQYKQVSQQLLTLIKQHPQNEQEFNQQMIKIQRIGSLYFRELSQNLQKHLEIYAQKVHQFRLSLTILDKIIYLKEQLSEYFDTYNHYSYLNNYFNKQPDLYQNNYYIYLNLEQEIKGIGLNQKYFNRIRNKLYTKTCLYIDLIHFQIKQQQNTVINVIELIDKYFAYKNINYRMFFEIVFSNLKQNISKVQLQHLIHLYQELLQEKTKLNLIIIQINEIEQQHPTLEEFKQKFIKSIQNELQFIQDLYPQAEQYFQIQDLDNYVEYMNFKENYQKQQQVIEPKIQEIIFNLPDFLQLTDIETQNKKKITIGKLFQMTHQLQQTSLKFNKKKNNNNNLEIEDIKLSLQNDIQFENDVICLLESMQYLHSGNLQQITEDFNDIDQKNSSSSLQQLIEVVQESSKKIINIKSNNLLEIKQIQQNGFQWILNFFKLFDIFRQNLYQLIFTQDENTNYLNSIKLENYEEFLNINRFSHLFYWLNQYPRKYHHWLQIKNELSIVLINSFKIYQKKIMEKIDILGNEKPLNMIQYDCENCEKVLKWFSLEQHYTSISKGVLLYQGYKKIKQINQQSSLINETQNQKYINDIFQKMNDTLNKLKEQQINLFSETKFAILLLNNSENEETDSTIYNYLQEEWTIDFMEKAQDLSFLPDIQNNTGLFDTNNIKNSQILMNIQQLLLQKISNLFFLALKNSLMQKQFAIF